MSSWISVRSRLHAWLAVTAAAGMLGGAAALAAGAPPPNGAAPNNATGGAAAPTGAVSHGATPNSAAPGRGAGRQGAGPPRIRTLFNSGDPTLALTPPLGGSRSAPPGSAPPNPDPHDFEGVWQVQGYQYLLGPEPGVPPPLKPKYMKLLEQRIRAKNRGTPEADTETQCLGHGMPRVMESPYPIEIVQT